MTPPTPVLIDEAIAATDALKSFLVMENDFLAQRKMEEVEIGLKQKIRLARELEKRLGSLKERQEEVAGDTMAKNRLKALQEDLEIYRAEARKNALLLKAAHQTTADVLALVKQVAEAQAPKSGAYGNNGQVGNNGAKGQSFVSKAV